ncbi:hypothetical protein EYF80_029106 [Liparis tanakae]|uniref:Uncharacterized protein n=1 Tax=Liparis tanakae TaxID=230148 RepID=A0A4Z2H6J7_9TELE|nr:hypothetical protein EYF80_029106 [Liparis tanakae]
MAREVMGDEESPSLCWGNAQEMGVGARSHQPSLGGTLSMSVMFLLLLMSCEQEPGLQRNTSMFTLAQWRTESLHR